MKSEAEIRECFNEIIGWRDKQEEGSGRHDTLNGFVNQGWCEALEWILDEREPTTADEYNDG